MTAAGWSSIRNVTRAPSTVALMAAGLEPRFVVETHLHADFVSGRAELVAQGAQLLAPAGSVLTGVHRPLVHGDEVELGGLTLQVPLRQARRCRGRGGVVGLLVPARAIVTDHQSLAVTVGVQAMFAAGGDLRPRRGSCTDPAGAQDPGVALEASGPVRAHPSQSAGEAVQPTDRVALLRWRIGYEQFHRCLPYRPGCQPTTRSSKLRGAYWADTMKDTVNAALRACVQAAERRQHVDVEGLRRFAAASRDLRDDGVMADAWR